MKLRIYNKTLDPNLWDKNQNLDPKVAGRLLKIANDFYNSTGLKGDIQDVLFLGSSANYTWNPSSDIDLHIVIDVAQQNITPDYARKFMDCLADKWNNEHKIVVKGHPVEVYLQDKSEPNSTPALAREGTSIYSLIDKKWLVPPNPQNLKLDVEKIQKKYAKLAGQIEDLVKTENIQKLKDLMKSIRNYRNAGLAKGGEFSTENIVFKALRRTGMLTKLKNTINTLYDRGVSLKESGIKPFIGESVVDIDRYLIFGVTNNELHTIAKKFWKDGGDDRHEKLMKEHPEFNCRDYDSLIHWIYKKKNNVLYYYGSPSKEQLYVIKAFLEDEYGIKNPIVLKIVNWTMEPYTVE